MNAPFNDHFECRYYLRLDLLRVIKVMLFTLTFIWIVNIVVLVISPSVSSKSTPCFTDGDCPSALEKCVYGSWKGLGNCQRKTRESGGDLRRASRSSARNVFRNRRLVRRKRNPSSIWNDSYLSQKRWDVWLAARQHNKDANQHSNAALQQRDTNEQYDEIVDDLLHFGCSYVTFKGINYSVAIIPATAGASDWLVTLTKDDFDADKKQTEQIMEERHTTNDGTFLQNNEHSSTNTQTEVASILLENSFENYPSPDAVVNISVRYPISTLSRRRYGGGSDIRLRFRRQLPVRFMELNSIDPLINHVTQVEPVIPSAEDAFGKTRGKRSRRSKNEFQRMRRELEEIEEDVAPLPKLVKSPDEGPIVIEDLYNENVRTSTLRKRRHHEAGSTGDSMHNIVTRRKRHHTPKQKAKATSFTNTGSSVVTIGSQPRKKRKLSRSVSPLASNINVRSTHRAKNPRAAVKQPAKKHGFKTKDLKRSHKNVGKTKRKTTTGGSSKGLGQSAGGALGGNTTNSGTTEPPDPFATLKNTKEPHIDYYDVSKRNLLKDEDDIDPESSLDEDDKDEYDEDADEEVLEIRRKRQTLAEELEDEDEQDIPSWRETVELLRRANTFAVPAHDSTGHVVLVRHVRDLGALDLGESLVRLKETMAKIFGRCSPSRRRKRSHRAPPEVVTDNLSNEETWEIQGEGNEVVDEAKIDVHMDDDKPYNVTTVLRPMGKRSYNYDRKNEESNTLYQTDMALHSKSPRGMRDILDQSASLDSIPYIKSVVKNPQTRGFKNIEHMPGVNERSAYSKRSDENIPINKDVHMEAAEGSPVEIDLTVDEEQPGAAHSSAEVSSNTLSTAHESQSPLSKRSQYRQSPLSSRAIFSKTGQSSAHLISSRNPSPHLRGSPLSSKHVASGAINKVRREHHEKCIGCKTLSRSAPNTASGDLTGRKTVREPYIITRKYNDLKTPSAKAEDNDRKTRELDDTGSLDRANLLYLADGDPLLSSWRAPLANVKRDVDISVEVEGTGNDTDSDKTTEKTTTMFPPSTIKLIIEEEKEDDVFSGKENAKSDKKSSSIEATASVTADRSNGKPRGAASIAIGSQVLSYDSPAQTQIIRVPRPRPKSVLTVESSDRSPAIEETISSGDLDWGVSGSSDRLMALISGIEKALRVPLGSSDSALDRVTVVDDSSNAVQTQIISSQPEETEQKTNYLYSINEPQPPLVVATSTQEKTPDVVTMDVTTGTDAGGTHVGELNENIYLKGFELPRKPTKPLFVDAAAKKMIWTEPAYKTVVSSAFPKYKMPLSYVRLYNSGLPRIKPIDQWAQVTNIQNLDSDTVEDVRIGNSKQFTLQKLANQPPGASITDIRASKTTEILQQPSLLGIQLVDNPPPEKYRDTMVKVVSSVSSDDPKSTKAAVANISPSVAVHVDGQDDSSNTIESNNLPSNIRIVKGRDSDGKIIAMIGSQSNLKNKKDLEEVSDASSIPMKSSRILTSNGIVLSENKLNALTRDAASAQAQGTKRNVQHFYRAPQHGKRESLQRRVNAKSATVSSKRASDNPAQPAPVVHTYSKDPGVQGATMGMMKDLASQLESQNAQSRNPQAPSRRTAACAAGSGNCRRKKLAQRRVRSPGMSRDHNTFDKSRQVSAPNIMSTRQIKKRDVSQTVFKQPKVLLVGPQTLLEAPGTIYKFIDSQERDNVTKHLKFYTISNISANADNKMSVEKPSVSDDSSGDEDEQSSDEDEQRTNSYDSASNLPMSHEKALQEAEGKERYKIVDSVEGFSVGSLSAASFDKKITSGGQISEDQMVPVPLEVDRGEKPHEENRISIKTDVERHKHKPGFKVSSTETADRESIPETVQQKTQTTEYVDSAQTGPDSHTSAAKLIQLIDGHSAPSTRKKRRSPNAGTSQRGTREEKIQALRSELQNLNKVGSKLGLNFFDGSSIDRIVREVSHQRRDATSQKEALHKRRSEMVNANPKRRRKTKKTIVDSRMEKDGRIPFKTGNKRNVGKRKANHASGLHDNYSQLGETMSAKSIEGLGNDKHFSPAKRERNNHRSISGHDRRRNVFKGNHKNVAFKRSVRISDKAPRDVKIASEVGDMKIDSEDGDMKIDSNDGDVKIDSEDGDVKIDSKDGDVKIDSEDGDVEIDSKDGDVKIDSEDGDVEIDSKDSDVEIDSKDGDVKIDSKDGDVEIDSKDGDVEIDSKDGDVEIDSEDGDVEVHSAEDDVNTDSSEDRADNAAATSYHYKNAVKNDDPLVITNPEKHELSNNREREETLTLTNKESDPMEVTAILRGRRKKREIRPDEFFRFSREGTLYRRSAGSHVTAPLNNALTGQWQKQFAPARIDRGEDRSKSSEVTPLIQNAPLGESSQRSSGLRNVFNSPRATFPRRPEQQKYERNYPQRANNADMNRRQQFGNQFPSQRNLGLQGREIAKEPLKVTKVTDDKDKAGHGKNDIFNNDIAKKAIHQAPLQPVRNNERNGPKESLSKTTSTTKPELPAPSRNSKVPKMGVWKKLGDMFDMGPKETSKPDAETTLPPTSSPDPLQAMVAGEDAIHTAPILGGRPDDRDTMRKPPEQSPQPESTQERVQSTLRAAIVDRLLQDLRKMASARGSEMARAESDLIEILHDYQTDLMDEDEKTIAGEPFQGVRIHDNVAIPVVYQAVPIKTGSLPHHRLVVRSSEQRAPQEHPSSWDNAPFNPP